MRHCSRLLGVPAWATFILWSLPLLVRGADEPSCAQKVKAWIQEQQKLFPLDNSGDPDRMLYFLHVPRTAGRTTHNCFLMPMNPPSRRCAKSYDGLKYNISVPDCGLISSHDDFSAMRQLPSYTAIYTTIRDPLDRFVSAYEFGVELGARDAVRRIIQPSTKQGKVNTKNVWPWNYLQPVMAEDIQTRKDARLNGEHGRWVELKDPQGRSYYYNQQLNRTAWELTRVERQHLIPTPGEAVDAYDNELYMSLKSFSEMDIVQELIINGQTLQVLGLTNHSHDGGALDLRACVLGDRDAGSLAVEYAKSRLKALWHVGVYDDLRASLETLAFKIGIDLQGQSWKSNTPHAFSYDVTEDIESGSGEPFLDETLPTKEGPLKRQLDGVSKKLRETGARYDKAKRAGESKDRLEVIDQEAKGYEVLRDRLQVQLNSIRAGAPVVSRLEATGRARQLVSDDEHLTGRTLSETFINCETNSRDRASKKRSGILNRLRRLDGVPAVFSREARQTIPEEIQAHVKDLNWMDMELYAVASELMQASIEARAATTGGVFKRLPAPRNAPQARKWTGQQTEDSHDEL